MVAFGDDVRFSRKSHRDGFSEVSKIVETKKIQTKTYADDSNPKEAVYERVFRDIMSEMIEQGVIRIDEIKQPMNPGETLYVGTVIALTDHMQYTQYNGYEYTLDGEVISDEELRKAVWETYPERFL